MTFTFNSKETYFAYRADWRERFQANLTAVRAAKLGIRTANREYTKDNKKISGIWDAYYALRDAHQETQELQSEIYEARAEAGRQMRAQNPSRYSAGEPK